MNTRISILTALASAGFLPASADELPDSLDVRPLDEVVITGHSARQRVADAHVGSESLELDKLSLTPRLFGENDIVKSITLLPGVHSEAEGAGGFEVRGGNADHIIVKADRRYHRVAFTRINYVEGLKDYVILHLSDGSRLITRSTIKNMEESLPCDAFMRVGKSYIVRLSQIDSFDTNDLFIGDAQIPIGAAYRDRVLQALMN